MSLTIADARRWRSMAMASPRAPSKIGDSGWEDRYAEVMAAGLSRQELGEVFTFGSDLRRRRLGGGFPAG